jgi:dTMP kinase
MSSRSYVAIEGIDGAGKSTVARGTAEALTASGHDVVMVREPGGTAVGEAIRHVLLDRGGSMGPWAEAMLFAAQRAQLAAEVVGPALAAGRVVLSDRSVYSSLAYQGGARGLGIEEVRRVNAAGLAGIWPGLVVLLRIDPAAGLAREDEADRISIEGTRFQAGVAAAYDALAAAEPERFVVIDATQPLADVVAAAVEGVTSRW